MGYSKVLTRRDFLRVTGAGAVGAARLGAAACGVSGGFGWKGRGDDVKRGDDQHTLAILVPVIVGWLTRKQLVRGLTTGAVK